MKVGPLFHALRSTDWAKPVLVHTGQHYDHNMSNAILEDLKLPPPNVHLGVGSGSHSEQTGKVMMAYEKVCVQSRPDWIVVVGDVNSTLACALVGAKLLIPVVHLEAGLRSRDRTMPEEINRLVTDAISDVLWTPSEDADQNLRDEGIPAHRIDRIGNIMIDSFEMLRDQILNSSARGDHRLDEGNYILVTLHRPSNVDVPEVLKQILDSLTIAARRLPVIFVAHPRTIKRTAEFGLQQYFGNSNGLRLLEPEPYVRFMNLVVGAKVVITDSGGLQEESTYLSIPCLTIRENTERPITVTAGTNRLVNAGNLTGHLDAALSGNHQSRPPPPLWDGQTAPRAIAHLKRRSGL
jgi:UDP-N-acetylglucosamine 2-epimerase (non-hydrolysing)